jgi:ORF6N domain
MGAMKRKKGSVRPVATIQQRIFRIRGEYVMIDRDLAELYQVSTKVLNQAVKRNNERFPDGFAFLPTEIELNERVTNCDRFKNLCTSGAHHNRKEIYTSD